MTCKHGQFAAGVKIARLEDSGRFMAEVRVRCAECGLPFEFRGLQPGLNMNGAAMSIDAQEAFLAIVPHGTEATPLDVIGFQIRGLQS